jgi:hypothetical protein
MTAASKSSSTTPRRTTALSVALVIKKWTLEAASTGPSLGAFLRAGLATAAAKAAT